MESTHDFLLMLGLDDTADRRAIRQAYARRLKQIDQAADASGFQALHDAYQTALGWAEYRAARAQALHDAPVQDPMAALPEVRTPAVAQAPADRPAQEAASLPDVQTSSVVQEAPPLASEEQLAAAVFERLGEAAWSMRENGQAGNPAAWRDALQRCLDDEDLLNIGACTGFEARIVYLLAQGWRPGNEAFFVAACDAFGWRAERRRLAQFGYHGVLLNRAIDELAGFEAQADGSSQVYAGVAQRLRQPEPPDTSELLHEMAAIEELAQRYPTLVHVTIGHDNVERWRTAYSASPSTGGATRDWSKQGNYLLLGLTLAMLLLSLLRHAYAGELERPQAQPAPSQGQQAAVPDAATPSQ